MSKEEHPFRPLYVEHSKQHLIRLKHLGLACASPHWCEIHEGWLGVPYSKEQPYWSLNGRRKRGWLSPCFVL